MASFVPPFSAFGCCLEARPLASVPSCGTQADFRVASVLFMRIGSVHHHTPNVLDECAKCFRIMQATIAKYSGMMARFNVDDKGTIMLA